MKRTRLNPAVRKNFCQASFFVSLFHIDPPAAIGMMNPSQIKSAVQSPETLVSKDINFASTQI